MAASGDGPRDLRHEAERAVEESLERTVVMAPRPTEPRQFGGKLEGYDTMTVTHNVAVGDINVMDDDGSTKQVGLWQPMEITSETTFYLPPDDSPIAKEADDGGRVVLMAGTITGGEQPVVTLMEGTVPTVVIENGESTTKDEPIYLGLIPIRAGVGKPLTTRDIAVWDAMARLEDDDTLVEEIAFRAYGRYTYPREYQHHDTGKITVHTQGISKLSREKLLKIPIDGKLHPVGVGPANNPGSVIAQVSLSYNGPAKYAKKALDKDDLEVADAAASLFINGKRGVTVNQIYAAKTGADSAPSKAQAQEIMASMDLQRWIAVRVYFPDELYGNRYTLKDGREIGPDDCDIEDYMIPAAKLPYVQVNGKTTRMYLLRGLPIFYRHDEMARNQIITYRQRLLEVTSARVARNQGSTVFLRSYLIMRIKTVGRLSPYITYESMYEAADAEDKSRTQKQRLRKRAQGLLDKFKEEGEIAGWKEYTSKADRRRNAKAITGIRIIPVQKTE